MFHWLLGLNAGTRSQLPNPRWLGGWLLVAVFEAVKGQKKLQA